MNTIIDDDKPIHYHLYINGKFSGVFNTEEAAKARAKETKYSTSLSIIPLNEGDFLI